MAEGYPGTRHRTDEAPVDAVPSDLVAHLVQATSLGAGEAARVVAEVLAYFSESTEVYVRRRHRDLQAAGTGNDAAFELIGRELPSRRVVPPLLSARQLRRIVYG